MGPQMTNRMKQAAVNRITKRIVSKSTPPDIIASTIAIDVQSYLDARIEKMGLTKVFDAIRVHGLETVLQAVDNLWREDLERIFDKWEEEYLEWLAEEERKEGVLPPTYDPPTRQRLFQPASRDKITKLLPYQWSKRDADEVLKNFGGCALSGETQNIALDHFIPVSWGHGGTYVGNIIPLSRKLNSLKNNRNPFEWIQDREVRKLIEPNRWEQLLGYLAGHHGLPVDKFEQYVRWCSNHRRSAQNPIKFSSFMCWMSST